MLSRACVMCGKGAKMVLFVTGKCHRSCWYCPISSERRGKETVYANENPVSSDEEIIHEARLMSALGTGVTGGEPLLCLDKVVHFCRILKDTFGRDHHIHLYTGTAATKDQLEALSGLVDEIRFHPPREQWETISDSDFIQALSTARKMGFEVTVEVPSLPGLEYLAPLFPLIDHLNINELEWSETNADSMRAHGHELEDDYHNAVSDAKSWAAPLLGHEKVHWCSSSYKDSVQLRERLKRIAANTARTFDEITDDGTIVYGVLETDGEGPALPEEEFEIREGKVEMAWDMLLRVAEEGTKGRMYVVERYPHRGMIVEITPI